MLAIDHRIECQQIFYYLLVTINCVLNIAHSPTEIFKIRYGSGYSVNTVNRYCHSEDW